MSKDTVAQLKPAIEDLVRKEEVRQVIAVPVQIIANLDGAHQMTLQVGFDLDEADSAISSRLDRCFGVIARQRAKFEIVTLEEELANHVKTLAQFTEDLDAVEARTKVEQARRKVEIGELEKAHEETFNAAVTSFRERGREGEYKPVGPVKSRLDGINMEIEKIQKEITIKDQERHVAVEQLEKSKTRYKDMIAMLTAKIAAKKALIGVPANDPEPDGA